MLFQKRWNFGLGTIFSLIVVYFIYLYSKDKGWTLLALTSKWYLIIVGGLIALSFGIILLIILILLSVLMISGSLVYYFNYQIKIARLDYEAKILDLSQKTAENLQTLKTSVEQFGINLSTQIGLVDVNLQNFKKQNQQEINTLSNLIDEIERQSDIKLSELKDELKDIRIKSADFS